MATWAAAAGENRRSLVLGRRVRRIAAVLAAAGLIAVLAVVAFVAGEHHQRPFTVLTGVATVGDQEATIIVGGWSYGISGDSVPWVDQQGVTHIGGWPACLGGAGRTVPVTFGEVPVTAPNGQTWRQVVWVDCQS